MTPRPTTSDVSDNVGRDAQKGERGSAGQGRVWSGVVTRSEAWCGRAGKSWCRTERYGEAWPSRQGIAWPGTSWYGVARLGEAGEAWNGAVWPGWVGRRVARLGVA